MANKTLPSSSGYFNKKMLAILEGETKKSATANKKPAPAPAKKGKK